MRKKLHEVIFGTKTKAGKKFDLILLGIIFISILIVLIESVPEWRTKYPETLYLLEWIFTIFFTVEYLVRIFISPKPFRYIFSFWGIIDLLAIIPTYLSLFPIMSGYGALRTVRALRLLRVFRILNLSHFAKEARALTRSLRASYYRIIVFLLFVLLMIVMVGTLMYVIEGGENGFDSIPASIYWAIVTATTVGFGDITPVTDVGKFLASMMMITGYAIIALPTGLISAELIKNASNKQKRSCPNCKSDTHEDSNYCHLCGQQLR